MVKGNDFFYIALGAGALYFIYKATQGIGDFLSDPLGFDKNKYDQTQVQAFVDKAILDQKTIDQQKINLLDKQITDLTQQSQFFQAQLTNQRSSFSSFFNKVITPSMTPLPNAQISPFSGNFFVPASSVASTNKVQNQTVLASIASSKTTNSVVSSSTKTASNPAVTVPKTNVNKPTQVNTTVYYDNYGKPIYVRG